MYPHKLIKRRTIQENLHNLKRYLNQDIDTTSHLLEAELLLLALATGIQDAIAYPSYHCFASNQTGNTVVFAVAIFTPPSQQQQQQANPYLSIPTLSISLALFIAGVLVAGQTANALAVVRRRWWLLLSNTLQTTLIAIISALLLVHPSASAGTAAAGAAAQTTTPPLGHLCLALLAFASGAQVGMVRALKVTDITTAMATAAYIDILIDREILAGLTENRGRNRRVGFLVCLVGGSFAGAAAYERVGAGVAMVVSLVLKGVVTVLFLCNRGCDVGEKRDTVV